MQRSLLLTFTAGFLITACGQPANGESAAAPATSAAAASSATAQSDVRDDAVQSSFGAISGVYTSEATHRYISFSYLHQGLSRPILRWRDWDATLNWNAEDPEKSTVEVTIDANSIDSGVDEFDGHLRGDTFFDVANHPTITFVSTSLTRSGEHAGTMTGDLTIKGNTKPVTLDVKYNDGRFNERGNNYKIGFSAKGTVKRSDFGVDAYTPFVGDDVEVIIDVEFEMPAK